MAVNLKKYCLAVMIGAGIGVAALVVAGSCGNNYGEWTIPVYFDEGLDFVPPRVAELENAALALRICHLFVEHGTGFLLMPMLSAIAMSYLWQRYPQFLEYPQTLSIRTFFRMLDCTLYTVLTTFFIGFMMGHVGVVTTPFGPPGSFFCALESAARTCHDSIVWGIVPISAGVLTLMSEYPLSRWKPVGSCNLDGQKGCL